MIRYSEKLKQNISQHEDGSIICEDETHYSRKELSLIKNQTDEDIVAVHSIKKIFCGEIVK